MPHSTSAAFPQTHPAGALSPARRTWLLTLLLACYACGFIDRLIIAIVGPAIVRDLHLSDLEFGVLGGLAFALFFSIFGIPIAWAAERRSRVTIIALSVFVWSAMTMASAAAQNYLILLLCRLGVGLGEAGYAPISHAAISDAYPRERRASALAGFSLGLPVGALSGAVAGGALAQAYGWRVAMLVLGAPGLLLALLVALTAKDPPRGRWDAPVGALTRPSPTAAARALLSSRTLLHITAGASLTTIAANGINLFAPTYFVRRFTLSLADTGTL